VTDAILAAKKSDKPVFIDFRVSKEENVYPMVPAGASINEFVEPRRHE
jgi:acetolactate synthase-1/2/3 large subunit